MASILITYGSGDGQTARVAHRLDDHLTDRGFDVTTHHVWDTSGVDVADFDGVLVGASVRNRHHQPAVRAFVERHREALAERPSGFFQLSFASGVDSEWLREGAREWVDRFVSDTGWHPDVVGLFGGAVTYSTYGPVTRRLFQAVSALTTGDTDTSRDYEHTDWDDVEAFADDFATLVGSAEQGRARRLGGLALVALATAGGLYWLARRRGRFRQETLDDYETGAPDEEMAAGEPVDATVGSTAEITGHTDEDSKD